MTTNLEGMLGDDAKPRVVCPETRQALSLADEDLVERLRQRITRGDLLNRGGETIEGRLSAGLLRADGAVLYPVIDGIPMLVIEDGIVVGDAGDS